MGCPDLLLSSVTCLVWDPVDAAGSARMVADRVFFFSLGRAAIIGSLCLAVLREYMSVGHSPLSRGRVGAPAHEYPDPFRLVLFWAELLGSAFQSDCVATKNGLEVSRPGSFW